MGDPSIDLDLYAFLQTRFTKPGFFRVFYVISRQFIIIFKIWTKTYILHNDTAFANSQNMSSTHLKWSKRMNDQQSMNGGGPSSTHLPFIDRVSFHSLNIFWFSHSSLNQISQYTVSSVYVCLNFSHAYLISRVLNKTVNCKLKLNSDNEGALILISLEHQ